MKFLVLLSAFALAGATLAGCGKAKEAATEKLIESSITSDGAKVDVDLQKGGDQVNISTKTDEGTVNMSVGEGATIPANFPKDVPLYPNLKVMVSHVVVEQESYTVSGTVQDTVAKVAEFYTKEAEGQGWKQEQAMNMPNMQNFIYKKDGRVLTVSAAGEGQETTVSITVTKE